jgi:hypothetical protein
MKPVGMDSLTVVCHFSVNRELRLYHGRANAIRPYNMVYGHVTNPENPDSKPGVKCKFYLETFRGEDDACIVSTMMTFCRHSSVEIMRAAASCLNQDFQDLWD